jgi:hypothetical protein
MVWALHNLKLFNAHCYSVWRDFITEYFPNPTLQLFGHHPEMYGCDNRRPTTEYCGE